MKLEYNDFIRSGLIGMRAFIKGVNEINSLDDFHSVFLDH
jgi:hypothetical protein